MYNLINDISILTTIPATTLNKLIDKTHYLICNDLIESINKKEDLVEIDVGIGTLQLKLIDNDVKYRFIPNKKLETNIRKAIIHGENPMDAAVEKALVNKITNAYKNFL